MALSDTRRDALYVVNEVMELLGYSKVTRLDANRQSVVLLRLLNTVIENLAYGDWQELYARTTVAAVSGQRDYGLGLTHAVQRIYEISFEGIRRSLELRTLEEFNQLERNSQVIGIPRQFTIRGVDSKGNPKFSVHSKPGSDEDGKNFTVDYYRKPKLLQANDADCVLDFPANVVIQGLYAEALIEQNGGMLTNEASYAYSKFEELAKQALNKFTGDTGVDTQFTPSRF